MPELPSTEDPFADLFGKLPDPRAREATSGNGTPAGGNDTPDEASPADAAAQSSPVPLSRRAAREAAAGQGAPGGASAAAQKAVTPESAPASAEPTPASTAPSEAPALVTDVVARSRSDTRHGSATAVSRTPAPTSSRTATATLDDLFTGEATTDALGSPPPPPDRRRRRIGGWIALGVVLVLLGGIAGAGVWAWNTYEDRIRAFMGWEEPKDYEAGIAEGEVTFMISSGDTGQAISDRLYQVGVTKTSGAFYDHLIETGQNPTFYPGAFRLQQKMTSEAALTALEDPANKLESTVQLREGLTIEQSVPVIGESLGIPIEEVAAAVADPAAYGVAAASLEGWLFPATYTFDPGLTPADIVRIMVERSITSLDAAGVPEADRQRVLTVASIIQREARLEDDFYKVSRVIQNRLETGMQLEMDSTAQYGYGELHEGTASTSDEAQFDENPWNTYVIQGLPAGPIANPGDLAIDAAMHPADGPWLFFVTVNLDTGETVFTTNADEHEAARQQWIQWCEENPDSGC